MCTHSHRHSIFCILPPYLLGAIARNGSPAQRAAATATLASDQTFRALRASLAAQIPMAQRRRRVLGLTAAKQRSIFTANNAETLPGSLVRAEGASPSGDVAVDEAYDGLGHTWDFYQDLFGRNSIDDEGLPLNATVHYGQNYDNAFWNGRQMVFGDGDGQLFNRFTIALDVIGHELAHGVTEDEAGLVYMFQPGALNEHLSDAFGVMIKQRVLNQTRSRSRLADRGWPARLRRQWRGPALDEPARHRLRRSGARQGSAAGAHGRLRHHLAGQWWRAHQFGHPEPCLPVGGAGDRRLLAGRSLAGSGTRRCATTGSPPSPASRSSRA